jgi:hypothetical protein
MTDKTNYADDRRIHDYSWDKSTEENYSCAKCPLIGKYKHLRAKLDENYHSRYAITRQLFQDSVIDYYTSLKSGWNKRRKRFDKKRSNTTTKSTTSVTTSTSNDKTKVQTSDSEPSSPKFEPFLLFTAGAMGAGKSHTLRWLAKTSQFPLTSAVFVDIDRIREHFPEMDEYRRRWAPTCGALTHKEAGYISELICLAALENGQSLIVDSSLRDLDWWKRYIQTMRVHYSQYTIGIMHVVAKPMTIFKRVANRGQQTGRMIPFDILIDSIVQTPISVRALRSQVDFFHRFDTNGDIPIEVIKESRSNMNEKNEKKTSLLLSKL